MVEYKTYTLSDLREWLLHNKNNGLSPDVINRSRAYAWINNPSGKDEDVVLVVVFDEYGHPVGYTGAFAEDYAEGNVQGRFYWGSTEWLAPEYRGQGIASKMMDAIKQAVGYYRYFASDSSLASVKLDLRQGSAVRYYPEYSLKLRKQSSVKSKVATWYISLNNERMKKRLNKYPYSIQVMNYVDDETYEFIRSHSEKYLFLRSQDTYNWLLRFPFVQIVRDGQHLEHYSYDFSDHVDEYELSVVQVRVNGNLVGAYFVSQVNAICTLRYLYYDRNYSNEVFASVSSYMLRPCVDEIRFYGCELFEFLLKNGLKSLNTKDIYRQIAFTTPGDFKYDEHLALQGGDGDMFT